MWSFAIIFSFAIPSTALHTQKKVWSAQRTRELPTSRFVADPTCSQRQVWIHNGHFPDGDGGDKFQFMYLPILATLLQGFEELTEGAAFIDERNQGNTSASTWSYSQVHDAIRTCVSLNNRPFLISVAGFAADKTLSFLQTAANLGAYLIPYQTEHPTLEGVRSFISRWAELGASEIWDFTYRNVDFAKQLDSVQPYRFVPPGYSHYLDAGAIDYRSNLRDEKTLGFLGSVGSRNYNMATAVTTGLNSTGIALKGAADIWTLGEVHDWVTSYPMQLNMHKGDSDDHGLETFRLSLLLSNRACVISTLSYPADADRFAGIVLFQSPSHLSTSITSVGAMISSCQENGYQQFKVRHAPSQILQQSGFLASAGWVL